MVMDRSIRVKIKGGEQKLLEAARSTLAKGLTT